MPLFMDIHHHVEGLTAEVVKGAHEADLATQETFGVRYLQYWFDEGIGKVFCLVDAPNAEPRLRSIAVRTVSSPMRLPR